MCVISNPVYGMQCPAFRNLTRITPPCPAAHRLHDLLQVLVQLHVRIPQPPLCFGPRPSAEGGLFLSQNTQSPVAQMKSLLFTTSLSRSFCVPLLAYDKLLTIEKERATKCLSMFLFVSLFQDLFFSMSLSEIDAHVLC